jgi:hypothetical protein
MDKKPFYVDIKKSTSPNKKLMAVFYNQEKQKIKTIHFGQAGASDMTQHKSVERMKLYDIRHKKNEDWENPLTAGALSKWILWNQPTLTGSINNFLRKFNLKKFN